MGSSEALATFLRRGRWRVVRTVDLGTTAQILVVEHEEDGERRVLKRARGDVRGVTTLLTEHRVLRYLNRSPMQPHVPRVDDWLPELDGFLMAQLRYPTPAEKAHAAWVADLAGALRTLHSVAPPDIAGLEDDRPNVGQAIVQRFRALFELVWRSDGFWAGLCQEDRLKLKGVRAQYGSYVGLLPHAEDGLADAPGVLTHGDLAGDNVMVTRSGRPVIVDWGAARIGAAWVDVASLATYSEWPADQRRRFYGLYLGDSAGSEKEAVPCMEILCRLHRYRSCVQSLVWLRNEDEGLDAVGRTYFERQLARL